MSDDNRSGSCITAKVRYATEADAAEALGRVRASRRARPDGKSPERIFYECSRCEGWHLSSRLPEPSRDGPQPRQTDETWEEYAHRLERRIKQQRDHITRILDLREEGNRHARKKIDGLVAALGPMTERWEHERDQKLGLANALKAREAAPAAKVATFHERCEASTSLVAEGCSDGPVESRSPKSAVCSSLGPPGPGGTVAPSATSEALCDLAEDANSHSRPEASE